MNKILVDHVEAKGGSLYEQDGKWIAEIDGWGTDDDYIDELCSLKKDGDCLHRVFMSGAKVSAESISKLLIAFPQVDYLYLENVAVADAEIRRSATGGAVTIDRGPDGVSEI